MRKEKIPGILFLLLGLSVSEITFSMELSKVEEKTFKFLPNGSISLTADEGSIVVKTWEKNEVYLKMTKRAWGRNRREAKQLLNEIQIQIYQGGNHLVIKELDHRKSARFNFFDLFDSNFWREKGWKTGVIDYELTVPKKVRLRLKADEGDVEVSGAAGKLTIDIDEGDVELEDVSSEEIEISADEGDVRIYDSDSKNQRFCKVDADEGRILLENAAFEELTLRADEGEIILNNVNTHYFWLNSDEGDIRVDFQPMEDGIYRMETDEGDIEISPPADASLRVRLRTEEGRIESDFDLPIRKKDDGEIMEGVIANNRGMLKAYTNEGYILLKKE